MSSSIRRALVACLMVAIVGTACDANDVLRLPTAKLSKRCSGEGAFARDSSWVLQCKRGRWSISMSINTAIDQINAYNAAQAARAAQSTRGTADAPLARSSVADLGNGWTVQIIGAELDGARVWATLKAENMFNDPPAAGHHYVLVGVKAWYNGSGSRSFARDVSGSLFGSGQAERSEAFGVLPNEFDSLADLLPGGSVQGDFLFEIPDGENNLRFRARGRDADYNAVDAWLYVG